MVPELFQTPEYARAVIRVGEPMFTFPSGNIQRQVQVLSTPVQVHQLASSLRRTCDAHGPCLFTDNYDHDCGVAKNVA
jgi:hypothetical protein